MDSAQSLTIPPREAVAPPKDWQPYAEPVPTPARQVAALAVQRAEYDVDDAEDRLRRAVEHREAASLSLWYAAAGEHSARTNLAAARTTLHALRVTAT